MKKNYNFANETTCYHDAILNFKVKDKLNVKNGSIRVVLFSLFMFFSLNFAFSQSTANYSFTTNTNGSLALDANGNAVDMTVAGGATQIAGASYDNGTAVSANLGFDFYFMGTSYNQISTSGNGVFRLSTTSAPVTISTLAYASGGTASQALIAPFARDLSTSSTGSITVRTVGVAPNRCFIIQYTNMEIDWNSSTSDGTYQARLYETTGVVEYVYGNMAVGTGGTATGFSLGFSSSNTASNFVSITTSSNTVSTSTVSTNSYTAGATIPNLHSTSDGSRRFYKFTPPVPVSGPTALNFTAISSTGMTLNWTAASPTTGIVRYIVQRSQDGGVTYNTSTNVALGTNTLTVTGLLPETTYTYRVVAVSEGAESTPATGAQATSPPAIYYWVGTSGGNWNTVANWNTNPAGGGTFRSTVSTTDVLIVDGDGFTAGGSTTINVDLASFTIGQFKVTNNTNLTLKSNSGTTRTITISGSGGDDFVVENGSTLNLNDALAVAFAFSGSNNTGLIAGTINFGGSTSNAITTTGGTGTLVTVTSSGVINLTTNVSLIGSATTLVFASGSNCNATVSSTAPPVPLATWDTNSTLTVSGLTTSTTAPTNPSQSFGNLVFNCPSLTVSHNWASTATIKGNLTITTGTGSFRLVSTGTATINGNVSILAGTFTPFSSTGTVIVNGNTIINVGANLNLSAAAGTYSQRGSLFTNNGTIIGTGSTTASVLGFLSFSDIPLTFDGSGTVSPAINSISVQTLGGLTISHTNQIPVLRTNLFYGNVTGSDKLIFGTGAALNCTIQMGATGVTNPAGKLLSAPNWNLGTGTLNLLYNQGSTSYTTGFEVPPTRTVNAVTINNTNGLTIAGGNLDVLTTLTMTSGVINTSTGNVLGLAGTLSGTPSATNMVNGPFNRTYAASRTASGTYGNTTVLPVGKNGVYYPIFVDPNTNAGGSVTFTGEAFNSNDGSAGNGVNSLSTNHFEALVTNGLSNLISTFVRISDANIISSNKILHTSTSDGEYNSIPMATNFATGILTTATPILVGEYLGYYAYGDVTPCSVPSDQATALNFPVRGTTTLTGSYTAAASSPTGYLVVRYANGATPTSPTDYTLYSAGSALGTGTVAYFGSALTFNATGLTANTTYDYYVYTYNNGACSGPVYNVSSPLMASVTTCAVATGTPGTPTKSNALANSFTATWTASSTSGVNYIVDVATNSGFTTFVAGYQGLNVGTGLSTNISGLSASTTYYVRVRADIGGCVSANSSTLTVTTECNAEVAPTSVQNFSTFTGTAPNPVCWSEATGTLSASTTLSGTTSAWLNKSSGFANISSANMGASINLYSTKNDWIISQPIDLGSTPGLYRLKYKYAVTTYNATGSVTDLGTHKVNVVVSTDGGNTWSNANIIKSYTGTGTYSTSGAFETINLTGYTGVVKIAFVATTTSSTPDIDFHIDDFSIEALPLCDSPSAVNATTSITDVTATINWLASSSNPANGYEWEVRTSGAGGSGSTGLVASGSVGVGVLTANVTGLSQSTAYSVYVRSNCNGTDFSLWTNGGGFTTLQTPGALPYTDDFTSNNFVFVNGTQTNKWAYGSATGNPANSIYISNDNGVSNVYNTGSTSVVQAYRDVLIPNGATFLNFSFDWNANAESCCDYLRVWAVPSTFVPTAGTQISSGSGRIQIGGNFNNQTTWQTYSNSTVNFSSFAGTTMRVVFEWYNDYSTGVQGPGAIDNISISAPSCIMPTALNSSLPTINGATISWTASSSNPTNGYDYYVSTSNTAPIVSTTPTGNVGSGTSVVLNTLNSSTQYYVWIRSNCGSGDFSSWTSSVTFTTLCGTVSSLPYNMNFESASAGSMPVCWSTSASSGSTTWAVINGDSGDILGAYQGSQFLEKHYSTSTAIAISQNFSFSSISNPTRLNVYLHRHADAHANDQYKIFVNTTASLTGATEVFSLYSKTTIAPTVASTGWYNYLIDIPTTFNGQSSVYVIIQGITTAGFSSYDLGVDNFTIELSPDCSITSVYNGTTWLNGGPFANQKASITGVYSGPGFSACELSVSSTGSATITSGVLNVSGNIAVATGGSLTIESGAYVMQNSTASNNGVVTVKRNSANMVRLDYTGWSSPVTGQNLFDFTPQTLTNRFYDYNPTTNAYFAMSNIVTGGSGAMFAGGKGYLLRAPNTWSSTTPTAYPGSFTGTLNNGNGYTPAVTVGYNIVGNPYPSQISASTFLTDNAGIGVTTLYFWSHTLAASNGTYAQSNYASFNGTGGTPAQAGGATPDGTIQVGQGFLIDVASAGSVNFNNSQRVSTGDSQFFRTTTDSEKHRIWLGLTSPGNLHNQILIGYVSGATNEIDASFDGKLFGETNSVIYTNVNSNKYAIQGRSLPFASTDVVSMGFKAQTPGQYTISLNEMDGLFAGEQNVYLRDNLLNVTHDIKTTPYSFVSEAGEFNSRFDVVYTTTALSVDTPVFTEESIVVYSSNNTVTVNAGNTVIDNVKVFDVRGRLLASKSNINATSITLENIASEKQVLIVQVTSNEKVTVSKKFVN